MEDLGGLPTVASVPVNSPIPNRRGAIRRAGPAAAGSGSFPWAVGFVSRVSGGGGGGGGGVVWWI